jgi:hypothetical protein
VITWEVVRNCLEYIAHFFKVCFIEEINKSLDRKGAPLSCADVVNILPPRTRTPSLFHTLYFIHGRMDAFLPTLTSLKLG